MNTATKPTGLAHWQQFATDPRVLKRIETEFKIASHFVKAAIKRGWTVSVCDGDEWTVKKSVEVKIILDAMSTTDEDILRVGTSDGKDTFIGKAFFIYGNDGYDVISDHTIDDERGGVFSTFMQEVYEYANKFDKR